MSYGHFDYTYTANGELATKADTTTGAVTHYTYDGLGDLREVELPDGRVVSYDLDGYRRRIAKRINGVVVKKWLYSARFPIAELDASNAVVNRFVLGEYLVKGGSTYRIVKDALGSPRLVVDTSTGAVAQRIDYDEWGRVVNDTAPGFQSFGFAGGLYDPDTGLVQFVSRDYDPEVGRWLSKDKIGFSGGQANLYLYVDGDPVNRLDRTGTDTFHFALALGIAFALDFQTDPNKAIFWSGDFNHWLALERVRCGKGELMEFTPGGAALNFLTQLWGPGGTNQLTSDETWWLWALASAMYAAEASGEVTAFVDFRGGATPWGIFWSVEYWVLRINPNVNWPIDFRSPYDDPCIKLCP